MFLSPDEYLLLMNLPAHQRSPGQCVPLLDDELKRLKDVGVQTILNYSHWNVVDKQGWGYVDELVEQARRVGLKCILAAPAFYPASLPDAWFGRIVPGGTALREVLSIWNQEATEALLQHFSELISRYGGPDVLVIYAGYLGGECVLHNTPSFYDESAVASYGPGLPNIETEKTREWLRQAVVNHFMTIDGFLVKQHQSIWNALQWLIAQQSRANGNFAQEDVLKAEFKAGPEAERVLLQYTYFAHGEPYHSIVQRWTDEYKLTTIIEAQYCAGLEETTPLAIEWGYRGQIVCPLHPWARINRLGQQQVDEIAKSHRRWREASRVS